MTTDYNVDPADTSDEPPPSETEEGRALKLVKWITEQAIKGPPGMSSAEELAREYIEDESYEVDLQRIESLIRYETRKNFTSGFLTGLGGVLTLPVMLPGAVAASWVLQARMVAAIAVIAGFDIKSDRVRTIVMATLVGDACGSILRDAGIKMGQGLTKSMIGKIPGRVLIDLNKKIGFRLITKAGHTGVVNMTKFLPFVCGIVGGTFDASMCRIAGAQAKQIFYMEKYETFNSEKSSNV